MAAGEHSRDASGNPILMDSGVWLRNEIKKHCKDADVKYIDPSYMIRSVPTISADRIYCKARLCWRPCLYQCQRCYAGRHAD